MEHRLWYGGKQKKLALGAYPEIGLKEARERLGDARRLLRDGVDPAERKREKRQATDAAARDTFSIIAKELMEKKNVRGERTRPFLKTIGSLASPTRRSVAGPSR